jgi:hypothetical protein
VVAFSLLAACAFEPSPGERQGSANAAMGVDDGDAGTATCEAFQTPIYAGQTIPAGTVTVSNDDATLTVEVATTGGWEAAEIHLYASAEPLPLNDAGNPVPGLFPYSVSAFSDPVTSWIFTLNLADELAVGCGDTLYVAVHFELVGAGKETGWAFGDLTWPGERWGWYFTYTICCGGGPSDPGCTYSQGYWKNHLDEWLADGDICGQSWADILHTPPRRGNAFYILGHQWIAAMLNVAAGADTPEDVEQALDEGQLLLEAACDSGAVIPRDDRPDAIMWSEILDAYNNGEIGPGYCDDVDDDGDDDEADDEHHHHRGEGHHHPHWGGHHSGWEGHSHCDGRHHDGHHHDGWGDDDD